VETVPAVRFARAARDLTSAARAAGLHAPAFRSPPRRRGAVRTIRRLPGGDVVAVQLSDRPFGTVLCDMVEGVVVANRLAGEGAVQVRALLRRALATSSQHAA
jgi:hypothetical protein